MKRCDDCPNQMACERADVCLHSSGRIRGYLSRQTIVDDLEPWKDYGQREEVPREPWKDFSGE